MFDQIRDRGETAIVLHDDNYLRLSFYRYEQIVNQIPDFAYMALGGGTSISEWPHFPHEDILRRGTAGGIWGGWIHWGALGRLINMVKTVNQKSPSFIERQ